jgi:hypothetical protein
MGSAGWKWKVWQVEEASVGRGDGVPVRELDVDWCGGRCDVGTWSANHDEVTIATAVGNCKVWSSWWNGYYSF